MILVVLLCCVIALAGGFIIGVAAGTVLERERTERSRPPAAHEVLAQLKARDAGGIGGRDPDKWYR